jgi:2-iminobutanoate/2-iminopropanoate deaminase
MKTFWNPSDVRQPDFAYTHQVEMGGPERLLILSGQWGKKEDGMIPSDPYEQLNVAFENLYRNLKAATVEIKNYEVDPLVCPKACPRDGGDVRAT